MQSERNDWQIAIEKCVVNLDSAQVKVQNVPSSSSKEETKANEESDFETDDELTDVSVDLIVFKLVTLKNLDLGLDFLL